MKIGVFEELSADDKTAHLILLGGIDYNPFSGQLLEDLKDVPVAQQSPRATDTDTGAFTVYRAGAPPTQFTPTVRPEGQQRILEEDVALFVRAPNPYNRKRTLTMCNGMHSRGTHGIVRALTDSKIQERNSRYIEDRFKGTDTYSILCRVSVVANEIVVPDWTLADIRLHEWPEAASDAGAFPRA